MQTFTQGFRELPFKNYIYFSLGLLFLTIIVVFALNRFLPPEVPLFYGKPVGEGQLTKTFGLAIAPLSALAVLTLNSIIATITKEVFIKKMLILASLAACTLVVITTFKIVFLVGFF